MPLIGDHDLFDLLFMFPIYNLMFILLLGFIADVKYIFHGSNLHINFSIVVLAAGEEPM